MKIPRELVFGALVLILVGLFTTTFSSCTPDPTTSTGDTGEGEGEEGEGEEGEGEEGEEGEGEEGEGEEGEEGEGEEGEGEGSDDPIVFVHGFGGDESNWAQMRAGLVERGFAEDLMFAVDINDTNQSMRAQADLLAAFVDDVLVQTGAERVDLVGHSLGGPVIRLYVIESGGSTARDVVTIAGANHGNGQACFTTFLGASSQELCPAFAEGDDAVGGVQTDMNGAVGADVDETPFGVEEGGPIGWTAIVFPGDTIIRPFEVECLDMAATDDCSAPVNVVLDFEDTSHVNLVNDDRVIEIVSARLR